MRLGDLKNYSLNDSRGGSIPAWCDWEPEKYVNPLKLTKVSIPAWCDWEPRTCRVTGAHWTRFNSSLVRLGVPNIMLADETVASFNSSLVRLGECENFNFHDKKIKFQFQLGAIGRIEAELHKDN